MTKPELTVLPGGKGQRQRNFRSIDEMFRSRSPQLLRIRRLLERCDYRTVEDQRERVTLMGWMLDGAPVVWAKIPYDDDKTSVMRGLRGSLGDGIRLNGDGVHGLIGVGNLIA